MAKDPSQKSSSTSGEKESNVLRVVPSQHHAQHPAQQFTHPLPYGAILHEGGVQFVVFSRSATAMRLLLYDRVDQRDPATLLAADPQLILVLEGNGRQWTVGVARGP